MSAKDMFLERSLPSNIEAERSVLGAILLDNRLCNQAMETLRRDDFYLESHRKIYEKMIALSEQGRPIDPVTLAEELRRMGEYEAIGGASYVAGLIDNIPRLENIEHYTKIVKGKSMMRRTIAAANQIIAACFEQADDPEQILDMAEKAIFAIAEDRARDGFVDVGTIAQKRLEEIEAMSGRAEMITGIPTGFSDLDKMTAGLQRSDLVILAARPSMGKCLAFDSEIVLETGEVATIETIYRRGRARLLTLGSDWKLSLTEPSAFVDDGVKPVFRVTTLLGREVETTAVHPFLTRDGWKRLETLRPGDRVGVPHRTGVFGSGRMRECEIAILSYLLSDRGVVVGRPSFATTSGRVAEDFVAAVLAFGDVRAEVETRSGEQCIRIVPGLSPEDANPVVEWLNRLGATEAQSTEVPASVFMLDRPSLALFLNRVFAADGWVGASSGPGGIGLASTCERFARQVQHLLLRFGVVAALKPFGADGARTAFCLEIDDAGSMAAFAREIGIFGHEEALVGLLDAVRGDIGLLRAAAVGGATGRPVRPGSGPVPLTLGGDVLWDEIVSIEPAGRKQVYDLTIPQTHNFVANDICVHNTSFALNVAQYSAKAGYSVGVFSLEMSSEQLVSRLLCSEARIDAHRFRTGYLNREEWAHLAEGLHRLAECRIFIDDTPGITVLEMRAKARRLKQEQGLDLLLVDYLQLIQARGRNDSRTNEVSQISRELKMLAKELNVPVIALSQLSRAPETRTDHRPQLSDLRESGSIEQDADVVAFIYREEFYNPTEETQGVADLIVGKQRNGPIGTVKLAFIKEFTRFENLWNDGY